MTNGKRFSAFSIAGAATVLALMFAGISTGQPASYNNGSSFTDPAVAPGSPAGSFALSSIESVNLANGNLAVRIPLRQIGGRGDAGYTMTLQLEYKWSIRHLYVPNGSSYPTYVHHYFPIDGWSGNPASIRYSPGALYMQRASDIPDTCRIIGYDGDQPLSNNPFGKVLSRMIFAGPDGTQLEFYDERTKGKPAFYGSCIDNPDAANRGTVWVEKGGSITFVSDTVFSERFGPPDDLGNVRPSGTLVFPNGTRYRIDQGKVTRITDRNGNFTSLVYGGAPGGSVDHLASATDSIGRVTTVSYGQTDTEPDIISYKGANGNVRTIEIGRNLLGNLLQSGQTLKSTLELFPGLYPDVHANDIRNPRLTAYVKLPDGRQFNFRYSSYSDLARVELPTGGAVEYDWDGYTPVPNIVRWVTERREYPNGESGADYSRKTKYDYFHGDPDLNGKPFGNTKVTEFEPTANGDAALAVSKHYFIRDYSLPQGDQFSFDDNTFNTEFLTEIYDAGGTALIRKVLNEYEFRQVFTSTIGSQTFYNRVGHRLARTTATLADVTPNLVSKQEFSYDPNVDFDRLTDVYEYDFGNGQPGSFKRRQHTDYLNNNPIQNNADYLDIDVYLRNLPLTTWVSSDLNGQTKASRAQYEYDDYSENPLVGRSNAFGHDGLGYGTGNLLRGNLTRVTSYSNAQNQTGAVSVRSQYDILGNVVKTTDAKGNSTTIDYSDNFGTPDDNAQTNSAPAPLNGLNAFAFPRSAVNPYPFNWVTGYAQYDYFTGAVVNTEDINGIVSKTAYGDPLDRPTESVYAVGTGFERRSAINYADSERKIVATTDLFVVGDSASRSETIYDGFGRTTESRRYEADGYISAKTEYDALGRVKRVSNPYRPLASEPLLWTESKYDSLGRVTEVKTPDDAKALTSYLGNATTVTDQAGAMRRSMTDALGHLVRVDEPNSAGQLGDVSNPNQPTNYAYDALSNLLQVQQNGTAAPQCGTSAVPCFQTRTFAYDSLSRLLSASNPESGTIQYGYDPNGNLTAKTDARGVVTGYVYDALNRVTNRSYATPNGTPGTGALANYAATPNVTYFYDDPAVPYSKGKLTKVSSMVSETQYLAFDAAGRVVSSKQLTDGASPNPTLYSYNLSGALIEQTYPSGRVVRNTLDNDGDLMQVQSRKANDTLRNYANGFTYTAAGQVSAMRLGNGKWESTAFNSRLQPTRIGLGGSASDQSLLKLDYTYGVMVNGQFDATKNNGNIQSQTITVPTVGSSNGFTAVQTYNYDALNRIDDATEMVTPAGSSTATMSWRQDYTFDRYGNRNFDETNTTTIPKNCADNSTPPNPAICDEDRKIFNPSVNASNNRLSASDGYQFDAAGNTIRDAQFRKFTYDAENKQTKVETVNSSGTVTGTIGEFFYDGDGRRVKKIANTNNQVTETTVFLYDASSRLVAEYSTILNPTPQVAYLTNDHLGSPRINTNENGAVASRHDYRPYGDGINERTHLDYVGDTIRKQFTGYERDNESVLDFAQARYFANVLGRFH